MLATASSDEKLDRLKDLGLDEGINYVQSDFVAEARRLTDGRGIDVIVDSVGGATLQGSLRALAYRGRCVTVGDAGRTAAEALDVSGMRGNNQTLVGYFLGAELLVGPRAHPMIAGLLDDIASGNLRVGDRPDLSPRRGGRGPRIHREPPVLRPGAPRPLSPVTQRPKRSLVRSRRAGVPTDEFPTHRGLPAGCSVRSGSGR